jgi:hypothetical protein
VIGSFRKFEGKESGALPGNKNAHVIDVYRHVPQDPQLARLHRRAELIEQSCGERRILGLARHIL